MDWLRELFTSSDPAKKAEQKANKRKSKEHSRRVRAREQELRRAKDNQGAKRASFTWGSPGMTSPGENYRGPKEKLFNSS
jgi:hypothetical protein